MGEKSKTRYWLTSAEFAREVGVDKAEITRSIRRGRIRSYMKRGKRRIDVRTERERFMATCRHAGPARDATFPGGREPIEQEDANGGNGRAQVDPLRLSLAESREVTERYKALSARIEFERMTGSLVRTAAVEAEWRRVCVLVRKSVMNIPDRLAPLVAAESERSRCWAILDEECRIILEDLSNEIIDRGNAAGADGNGGAGTRSAGDVEPKPKRRRRRLRRVE